MTDTTDGAVPFGALLQRQRQAAGLSQQELAERAGLSRRGISDLERGRHRSPYPATMRRLADGLGLGSDGRAALFASAYAHPTAEVLAERHAPLLPPLPIPSTTFIGRKNELDELRRLLTSARLLTLTGAGGSGKTRLALEAASASSPDFPDGTALVQLASVANPELVAPAIAQALAIREIAGVPLLETLVSYLRPRKLLLLVDNFEHLLSAAPMVGGLVSACPNLTVLATSREALRLRDEHEFSLAPLELPQSDRATPVGALLKCASVELLADRSAQARPSFLLTPEMVRVAADICARLDGLPLAIELAAARARIMSPALLLERLDRRLALLIGGARDLPTRQRTLRDTIAWSHDLLTPGDQSLFRRLSVFTGGCTLPAAEALCEADGDLGQPVLDGVASLVDKHLVVRVDGPDGEPRFVMLETIREFATEQLEASGEADQVRARHAAWFGRFAEDSEPQLRGKQRQLFLARVETDRDNVRAALRWSLDQGRPDPGLRIMAGLWLWWYLTAIGEGLGWTDSILRLPDPDRNAEMRSKALFTAGLLAWGAGNLAEEARLLKENVALAREVRSTERLAWAMVLFPLSLPDARAQLHTHYAECLESAEASGNAWLLADAHLCYGASAAQLNDPVTACAEGRQAIKHFHALGDDWFEGLGEVQLGLGLLQLGDLNEALLHLEAALRLVEDWKWRAVSHVGLGLIARMQGSLDGMGRSYSEGLVSCRDAGDVGNAALALEGLAATAAGWGASHEAVRLLGAAEAARASGAQPTLPGIYERHYPKTHAAVQGMLDEASFLAAWSDGQQQSLDQAVDIVQSLLESHSS